MFGVYGVNGYFLNHIIQQVAYGGVAEAQVLCHFFQAAAALYKVYYKILLLCRKAGKQGQGIPAAYFSIALLAYQGFYL